MKIKRVYIGGWFQRTTLHLSEIYDFLREGYSSLELDKNKLKDLQKNLDIESAELKVHGLEHIEFGSKNGISLKIHEDGLIALMFIIWGMVAMGPATPATNIIRSRNRSPTLFAG